MKNTWGFPAVLVKPEVLCWDSWENHHHYSRPSTLTNPLVEPSVWAGPQKILLICIENLSNGPTQCQRPSPPKEKALLRDD